MVGCTLSAPAAGRQRFPLNKGAAERIQLFESQHKGNFPRLKIGIRQQAAGGAVAGFVQQLLVAVAVPLQTALQRARAEIELRGHAVDAGALAAHAAAEDRHHLCGQVLLGARFGQLGLQLRQQQRQHVLVVGDERLLHQRTVKYQHVQRRVESHRAAEEGFKLFVWTLSAVLCGLAGALYVPQVGIINPGEMSPTNSIEAAIWVALGGRGTLVGPLLGAGIVNGAKSWFTMAIPEYWQFFLGLMFIVVTLFLPKGVIGLLRRRKSS